MKLILFMLLKSIAALCPCIHKWGFYMCTHAHMTTKSLNRPTMNDFMHSSQQDASHPGSSSIRLSFPARRRTALSLSVHQRAPSPHVPLLKLLRSPEILTKPLSVRGKGPPLTPTSTFIPRPSNCCGDNYSRMRSTCCASTASFFSGRN